MKPLSKSNIWDAMQSYYNKMGPDAWQQEVVPSQVSSNKYLATIYADLIVAAIKDHIQAYGAGETNEPYHLVEVGAGHGKFGFYVLKAISKALEIHEMPANTIRYVLTDISEKNVNSWKEHPALQAFIDSKQLDVACFDALADKSLDLQCSGETITEGSLGKPVFMLCNYLFDTLSHDAFQVRDGKLHEMLVEVNAANEGQDFFKDALYHFEARPIDSNYYDDPILNKILKHYEDNFRDASFLIPVGGLQCFNTIQRFSNGPLYLLVADKGVSVPSIFEGINDPDISFHGSVSLMVNFDAVREYISHLNGRAWITDHEDTEFQVCAFASEIHTKTTHFNWAFHQNLTERAPHDVINICYHLEDEDDDDESDDSIRDDLSLAACLSMLNLACWDPNVFFDLHEVILHHIEEDGGLDVEQDINLKQGAKKVWEYAFKLEASQDIPFAIGSVFYALDEFDTAVQYYKKSVEWFGENSENQYNLALCYDILGDKALSVEHTQKALVFDPDYIDAKNHLRDLEEELQHVS